MQDCTFQQTSGNHLALDCAHSIVDGLSWFQWVGIAIFAVVAFIALCMLVFPIYGVWSSRKKGQADLAEAQYEQQIQVAKAKGRKDAADLNKQAAIVEAEAVREQIDRIGESLKTHDLYLRWQWIRMMEDREGETIYVPTEANLPILEATRRRED